MTNELSVEDAIEALYTVRAYYASLTAGYPKGIDCRGIGDVMCSEIANSCLMAIKALESQRWIPVSERPPEEEGLYIVSVKNDHDRRYSKTCWFHGNGNWFSRQDVEAWMPLPESYNAESEDKE